MSLAPSYRTVWVITLLYTLLLVPIPLLIGKQDMHHLFSEEGPFEVLSAVFWAVLGLLCLSRARQSPRAMIPCALAAFIGCARELDLHTALTGVSLFKSSYYLKSAAPLGEKLLAAAITLIVFAVLVDVARAGLRALRQRGALQQPWLQTSLLAIGAAAFTKLLDKLQSFVHDFTGHWLPQLYSLIVNALEEGMEMSLPLLFIVALVQFWRLSLGDEALEYSVANDGRY